jgi:hypothetical protein
MKYLKVSSGCKVIENESEQRSICCLEIRAIFKLILIL